MISLNVTTNIPEKNWSKFVLNNQFGTIFHSPEMVKVYNNTKGYDPLSIAVTDNNGKIIALMNSVLIKETKKILKSFSARYIIFGEPILENDIANQEAVLFLMDEYNKIAEKRALYSEIRNVCDMSKFEPFLKECGYHFEDHLNYIIDLKCSEEEIFSNIHKSMRKNINKAKKNGIIVNEVLDRKQIIIFYEFLKEIYSKAKKPLMDLSYFEAIYDILVPLGMAKFHLAEYNNQYIGGRVTLMYKDVIYAHYVATSSKYKKLNPNALLNWELIRWGAKNGYHYFDFGGAGNPKEEYGVREFKRQFGGKLVNYGRYKKTHSNFRMKIAELGFSLYRKTCL